MGFIRHRQVPEQVFPKLPMGGFKDLEDVARYLTSLIVALRAPSDPQTVAARATRSTNQTLTSGVATVISFDAAAKNNGGLWNSVNPTRLTAVISGWYGIFGCAEFAANATGIRHLALLLNGTTTIDRIRLSAASAGATTIKVGTWYPMNVNDYVELQANQTSTVGLDVVSASDYSPVLAMAWLAPVQA